MGLTTIAVPTVVNDESKMETEPTVGNKKLALCSLGWQSKKYDVSLERIFDISRGPERPEACRNNAKNRRKKHGETLTVADATITDQLKSRSYIVHGDRFPDPSPVPNDLDSHRTAIEREALRRELLIATFQPDSTAGKCDIGNASTATILREQANLRRARSCYQLDVLKTGSLSDLIVETRDQRSGGNLSDLYDDISNLAVEISGIDVVSNQITED